MNGLIWLVAASSLGVDYGWQVNQRGETEYIIQIEPHMVDALKNGEPLVSEIPANVKNVRRVIIRVGTGLLPRQNLAPAVGNGAPALLNASNQDGGFVPRTQPPWASAVNDNAGNLLQNGQNDLQNRVNNGLRDFNNQTQNQLQQWGNQAAGQINQAAGQFNQAVGGGNSNAGQWNGGQNNTQPIIVPPPPRKNPIYGASQPSVGGAFQPGGNAQPPTQFNPQAGNHFSVPDRTVPPLIGPGSNSTPKFPGVTRPIPRPAPGDLGPNRTQIGGQGFDRDQFGPGNGGISTPLQPPVRSGIAAPSDRIARALSNASQQNGGLRNNLGQPSNSTSPVGSTTGIQAGPAPGDTTPVSSPISLGLPGGDRLAVADTSLPSEQRPAIDVETANKLAAATEPEKPWWALTVACVFLFASVGLNVYLGWVCNNVYGRYRKLATDIRQGVG